MKQAKLNYLVDAASALAFLGSALSGLVFLLPAGLVSGPALLVWNQLHTYSSLALIAGVGVHLALHWKWIVAMTRKLLAVQDAPAASAAPSRRAFLTQAGIGAVAVALAAAGLQSFANAAAADGDNPQPATSTTTGSDPLTVETVQQGVACRFGLVNDPYPGQCRHYRDSDGDNLCDYSIPGSGSVTQGTSPTGGRPGRSSG